MSKLTVYLAGPMSSKPDKNKPLFDSATACLRELGYDVISPAELDIKDTASQNWNDFMVRDIPHVLKCDVVVLLTEWYKSRGTLLEVNIAGNLGKPIFTLDQILGVHLQK